MSEITSTISPSTDVEAGVAEATYWIGDEQVGPPRPVTELPPDEGPAPAAPEDTPAERAARRAGLDDDDILDLRHLVRRGVMTREEADEYLRGRVRPQQALARLAAVVPLNREGQEPEGREDALGVLTREQRREARQRGLNPWAAMLAGHAMRRGKPPPQGVSEDVRRITDDALRRVRRFPLRAPNARPRGRTPRTGGRTRAARTRTTRCTPKRGPDNDGGGEPGDVDAGSLGPRAPWGSRLPAAVEFLAEVLAGGWRPVADVEALATARGIAAITLRRARAALGVRVGRVGFGPGGVHRLGLPGTPRERPGAAGPEGSERQDCQDAPVTLVSRLPDGRPWTTEQLLGESWVQHRRRHRAGWQALVERWRERAVVGGRA